MLPTGDDAKSEDTLRKELMTLEKGVGALRREVEDAVVVAQLVE